VRALPDTFDPDAVARIDALLDETAQKHGVAIPLAIESGSRAWGFPSPDSDYDCRFVYVRPVDDHLSPWPVRDVLEEAPDDVLDVNGWDLRKAVQLLVAGNATVLEWAGSPLVYRADPTFRAELLALVRRVADRPRVASHYLGLGQRQDARFLDDDTSVPLKKVFYALRPALALAWLRQHPTEAAPPMRLQDLLAQIDLPADVVRAVEDLVERKSATRELGTGELPAPVRALLDEQLRHEDWMSVRRDPRDLVSAREDAGAFVRAAVHRYDPHVRTS
jgi:hypothetical protein